MLLHLFDFSEQNLHIQNFDLRFFDLIFSAGCCARGAFPSSARGLILLARLLTLFCDTRARHSRLCIFDLIFSVESCAHGAFPSSSCPSSATILRFSSGSANALYVRALVHPRFEMREDWSCWHDSTHALCDMQNASPTLQVRPFIMVCEIEICGSRYRILFVLFRWGRPGPGPSGWPS
jgi:hypothetical protein